MMPRDLESLSDAELEAIVNGGGASHPMESMSDAELEAIAGGGKPATVAEQPDQESYGQKAKKMAAGFMTGVGSAVPLGQDIPAVIGATLSKMGAMHGSKNIPEEGSWADRYEAAKRAQMRAADIAYEQAPKSSIAGKVTGFAGSLPAVEFEAPLAAAVEAGTAAKLAKVADLGPAAKKAVDIAAKGVGLGAAGATTGALYGYGEGVTPEEHLAGALSGAKLGAGFNVAAPAVVSGVRKVVGATPLSKAEQAAVDLGAPMPAAVTSKHPITKLLSDALNVHPLTKTILSEGVEGNVQRLGEASMEKAGLKPGVTPFQAGESVKDSIINWVDKESRDAVDDEYKKFERLINPTKKTPLLNTEKILKKISGEEIARGRLTRKGQPKLTEAVKDLSQAIKNSPYGMNYDSIQAWKRDIGRRTSQIITSSDVNKEHLDLLYGALSNDVRAAAENAGGKKAREAYDRANAEAKSIIGQRKEFESIIKKQGDQVAETVFEKLKNSAREGGRGNEELLKSARSKIKPDDWNLFASKVAEDLGTKGGVFNPSDFVKNYNSLTSAGKDTLFGPAGNPTRKALEDTLTVADKYVKAKKDQHYSKLALAALSTVGLGLPLAYGADLSDTALGAGLVGAAGVVPIAYALRQPRLAHTFNRYMQNPNPAMLQTFRNALRASLIHQGAKKGQPMDQQGREERASGGKVNKRDYPAKRLNKLERMALRARQEIALETKPIMDQPDALVAKALEIANNT